VLAFRGELKMQWMESDAGAPVRIHFSLWKSILSSLGLYPSPRPLTTQITDGVLRFPALPSCHLPSRAPLRSPPVRSLAVEDPESQPSLVRGQEATIIPVTAHMQDLWHHDSRCDI
jgi:hypothetical protein